MLISLPTLLARSKRRKEALACFSVNSVWTMEAVLSAVARHKRGKAAIVIDAGSLGAMPLEAMVAYALHSVHATEGEVALAVRTTPVHEDVTRALESGVPSIWLSRHHRISEPDYAQACRWSVDRAYLHGCSVVGESGSPTLPMRPEDMVREYGVSVLGVHLPVMMSHQAIIDSKLIGEASKQARVPLIGLTAPALARERSSCAKEGIAGFFYSLDTLNEPFGAGLRTGLRDRSQSDPVVYQNPGLRAAAEAAANRLFS